jgi:hypothetical protein
MLSRRGINPTAEDALPPTAVREILRRLPADQRARAACVCRAWREVVADPALWTVLDFKAASGARVRLTPERLLAAAARAQGRLEVLNVPDDSALFPALLAVATANATLRELSTLTVDKYEWYDGEIQGDLGVDDLQALLLAAPALQVLGASVRCTLAIGHRLLRREPPFGPVRLRELEVVCKFADRDIAALAADLTRQTHPLDAFCLTCSEDLLLTPDELDSVVTAALAIRLPRLDLNDCHLTPEAVPALCRLLSSVALTALHIFHFHSLSLLLDDASAVLLGEALHANRTLTSLSLCDVLSNGRDTAVLLLSLVGHASIRALTCISEASGNPDMVDEHDPVLIGMCMRALIAADSPALKSLNVSMSHLGDAGLGPLCDALPRNTHLRNLRIQSNGMSAAFAAQRLLPAVRANRSLRLLEADAVADDAMQLVNARRG